MKQLLILFGVGVAIIAASVFAGLYGLSNDDITTLSSDLVVTKRIATKDGTTSFVAPDEEEEETVYIQLEPVLAPIREGNKITGKVKLVVNLELISRKSRSDLMRAMPLVLALMFEDFYQSPIQPDPETGKLDISAIEQRIETLVVAAVGVDLFNRNVVRSAKLLKIIKQRS